MRHNLHISVHVLLLNTLGRTKRNIKIPGIWSKEVFCAQTHFTHPKIVAFPLTRVCQLNWKGNSFSNSIIFRRWFYDNAPESHSHGNVHAQKITLKAFLVTCDSKLNDSQLYFTHIWFNFVCCLNKAHTLLKHQSK